MFLFQLHHIYLDFIFLILVEILILYIIETFKIIFSSTKNVISIFAFPADNLGKLFKLDFPIK